MLNLFEILKIPLLVTVLGGISALIGTSIAIFILIFSKYIRNIKSSKIISSLYILTSGIMIGIVCFDILPEVLDRFNMISTLFFILLGIFIVFILDYICEKKLEKKSNMNTLSISKIILILSMSIHNFIEGIAIGATYSISTMLGFKVLSTLFLHDIPEGMVVFITDIYHLKKSLKTSIIVGMITGIGVFLGRIISNISVYFINISMSIAIGAMLYVISCDLIPNSNYTLKNRKNGIFLILGIIISLLICYL